ncbi:MULTISPECIES: hypothetical protein [Vagococcus]|uniref:Uncharacterized protein n=1 Tax=Vagococcus fluvialis bH819 TaxID=1255619 RepID=A0A1X6WRU2_9ENTE|nr:MULTISPECIES: hypothetical protein [Vagococcus]SLM86952.1 hypothetical protein FM121_12720 [Vagococcus fluvialis bH819]
MVFGLLDISEVIVGADFLFQTNKRDEKGVQLQVTGEKNKRSD